MKRFTGAGLLLVVMLLAALPALAQGGEGEPVTTRSTPPDPEAVTFTEFVGGFNGPIFATHAGDGSGRLFVLEQTGRIWIVEADGTRLDTPFLDLSGKISRFEGYSEQGLLGLAFHPEYAENGRLFVNYTDDDGETVVAEFAVANNDPNIANPISERELLRQPQPYANHNGGMMAFGPDGYLYISLGDGGSGGDPEGNGQNPWTWLGSILRIDVDGERPYSAPEDNPFVAEGSGAPEIWAWGLRNVWRFSFDRATGDLYLADVGQNQWEEVNFQAADSPGGENYGWNRYEASHPYSGGEAPADMVLPVAEYNHSEGGCSITGGYAYRGETIPEMQGVYLYGDWCTGLVFSLYRDDAGEWQAMQFTHLPGRMISSFGEDEAGELYIVDYNGGGLWRMEPAG
ncbi:MAG: PQQ-dependent sugar dehydrogenase [Anaerolineae bacterium]|nr:PQQ-dependent sugar dehydrogenase [Anaerolineae bacterium]